MIYMLTQDSYLLNINSQASQKSGAFFLIANIILPIFIRKVNTSITQYGKQEL